MEEEFPTLRTRNIQKCDISPSINELTVQTLPGPPGRCSWFEGRHEAQVVPDRLP
jgi:hypothetical protein